MTLIKTSILSFIAAAVKIVTGLVITKAVALYIGAAGLALIGQFQNFTQVIMTVAQGAINGGVTKYTAEYGKNDERIPLLFSTASKISLSASLITAVGIVCFSKLASWQILKSEDHGYIFIIFGFTLVLFVFNSLLLSILNGLKETKTWAKINIIQSGYSLIFTTLLIFWLGLDGALIALVTNQSVIFLIVLWMLRKHPIIKFENFRAAFDMPKAKQLAHFSAMAVAVAVITPISHLMVRNHIVETLGWDYAGYWQAIWFISTMYLMMITSTLSIYYLPRLSEITLKIELRKELLQGYKIIMPVVIVIAFVIFLLKDFIIWLIFSPDFAPMSELFLFQLVGDVMKIASWLLSYILIAKAKAKTFIITEIIFGLSFVVLSTLLVDEYGLIGMSYSFALNYSIYFFALIAITRQHWR